MQATGLHSLLFLPASSRRTLRRSRLRPLPDASNSATPAATDTFKLLDRPRMGIDTSRSQRSRTSRRRPVPSAPSTSAVGTVKSTSIVPLPRVPRQADGPDSRLLQLLERPRDVHDCRRRGRGRPPRPTPSWPPPSSAAACRAWRTTPWHPAASTARSTAPTFCGSSMPSSTTSERRLRRRGGDELRHAVIARRHELGHDSLVHAASRRAFERLRSTRSIGTPF